MLEFSNQNSRLNVLEFEQRSWKIRECEPIIFDAYRRPMVVQIEKLASLANEISKLCVEEQKQ